MLEAVGVFRGEPVSVGDARRDVDVVLGVGLRVVVPQEDQHVGDADRERDGKIAAAPRGPNAAPDVRPRPVCAASVTWAAYESGPWSGAAGRW